MKVKIFDKSYEFPDVYVTSDLHISHKNIAGEKVSNWKSGYRTFDTLYEMDNCILRNLLDVGSKDLLVLLGDTLMAGKDYEAFLEYIDCDNIVMLLGNHCRRDKLTKLTHRKLLFVGDYLEMSVDGQFIVCSHYPMVSWNHSGKGAYMLHGHLHADENKVVEHLHRDYKVMDVGIDNYYKLFGEYKPFRIREIKKILENKTLNEHHEEIKD